MKITKRFISPPLEEHDAFRTPLEPGEKNAVKTPGSHEHL